MKQNDNPTDTDPKGTDTAKPDTGEGAPDRDNALAVLTDKWKRALADAENARKRADASRLEGREHGIVLAVDALAPAFDAVSLAIETAQHLPDPENPRIKAHLQGLMAVRAAFETGLQALGVRIIAPKDTVFDPALHEAMQIQETDKTKPGNILVLHRPGFAIGQRLIRPAHVTVSAAPANPEKE